MTAKTVVQGGKSSQIDETSGGERHWRGYGATELLYTIETHEMTI